MKCGSAGTAKDKESNTQQFFEHDKSDQATVKSEAWGNAIYIFIYTYTQYAFTYTNPDVGIVSVPIFDDSCQLDWYCRLSARLILGSYRTMEWRKVARVRTEREVGILTKP